VEVAMNKRVAITIRFENKETLRLRLSGGMFRRISLFKDGKFEGYFALTKIINRIRIILVEYFKEKTEKR
jgi:hypothetical protein